MATLTGNTIASTYKQLLKLTSEGVGADASAKYIEDGLGTDTALSLSTTRVGIGMSDPETTLDIRSTGTQLQLEYDDSNAVTFAVSSGGDLTIDPSGSDITLTDTNSFRIHSVAESSNNQPTMVLKSTFDSTTHQGAQFTYQTGHNNDYIADTQIIGDIGFETIKSDNSTAMASALIRCQAEGTHTTSSSPAGLRFWTTPSGSTTLSARMIITSTGRVGIGVTNPDCALEVNGALRGGVITVSSAGPTDNVDVSGANVVFLDTSSNNVTVGGFTGGVQGQEILLYKATSSNDAVLEHNEGHGNQNIYLLSNGDETVSNYGGWNLVCSGSHWFAVGK